MNKAEIKQKLLTVSLDKIKDLLLENKISEAQAALEIIGAQLKEIDNNEDIPFKVGDYVTVDHPARPVELDIYRNKEIMSLDNIYKVVGIDKGYILLEPIKNRDILPKVLWHKTDVNRITKLNFHDGVQVPNRYQI